MLSSGFEVALAGVLIGVAIPVRTSGRIPLRRIEREVEPWGSCVVIPLLLSAITASRSMLAPLSAPRSSDAFPSGNVRRVDRKAQIAAWRGRPSKSSR
jgi:hypothetical protein